MTKKYLQGQLECGEAASQILLHPQEKSYVKNADMVHMVITETAVQRQKPVMYVE